MSMRADADEIGAETIRRFADARRGITAFDDIHFREDAALNRFRGDLLAKTRKSRFVGRAWFDDMHQTNLSTGLKH